MYWLPKMPKTPIGAQSFVKGRMENASLISTFDFSTLYTKLPHKDLLKIQFDLIDFRFNSGSKKKKMIFP